MGLDHLYARRVKTTQISEEMIRSAQDLTHAQRHNDRTEKGLGETKGKWIDSTRTKLNQTIVSPPEEDLYHYMMEKITGKKLTEREAHELTVQNLHYANGHKVNYKSTLGATFEMSYPGDLMWSKFDSRGGVVPLDPDEEVTDKTIEKNHYFLMPADKKLFQEWVKRTRQFLFDNFDEKNVLSMDVHLDEEWPHIHAIVAPFYQDEDGMTRISSHRVLSGMSGDLRQFKNLQTAYAERFADLGFVRGHEFSARAYNSETTNKRRARMARALAAELPEDRQEAEEAYQSVVAKLASAEDRAERAFSSARTIEKQSKVMSDQQKKIREQEQLIAQQKEQIRLLQQMVRRQVFEDKGLELMADKRAASVYVSLKNQLIESGQEYDEKVLGHDHEEALTEEERTFAMGHDSLNDSLMSHE